LSRADAAAFGTALQKHAKLGKPSLACLRIDGLNKKAYSGELAKGLDACITLEECDFTNCDVSPPRPRRFYFALAKSVSPAPHERLFLIRFSWRVDARLNLFPSLFTARRVPSS